MAFEKGFIVSAVTLLILFGIFTNGQASMAGNLNSIGKKCLLHIVTSCVWSCHIRLFELFVFMYLIFTKFTNICHRLDEAQIKTPADMIRAIAGENHNRQRRQVPCHSCVTLPTNNQSG